MELWNKDEELFFVSVDIATNALYFFCIWKMYVKGSWLFQLTDIKT